MRKNGIFQRNDGKFEVWVKIQGGLDCKGVFLFHDNALRAWVTGQPNDGVRRAILVDSIPTYTEADLEASCQDCLSQTENFRTRGRKNTLE